MIECNCNNCEFYDGLDKYCTQEDMCYVDVYNKAINDFAEKLKENLIYYCDDDIYDSNDIVDITLCEIELG